MPHVDANRMLLKVCFRKRPFPNREAASAERPEDFEVYRCPICKQWHRASSDSFKAERIKDKQIYFQRRKRIANKKKEIFRAFRHELPI